MRRNYDDKGAVRAIHDVTSKHYGDFHHSRETIKRYNQLNKYKSRDFTQMSLVPLVKHITKGLCPITKDLTPKPPISIKLIILSSQVRSNISQNTFDKASEYDIEIFAKNEWTGLFKSLKTKWFETNNSALALNELYKKELENVLYNLSGPWTSFSYFVSKLKKYNSIRDKSLYVLE